MTSSPTKSIDNVDGPNSADSKESTIKRYIIGETYVSPIIDYSDIDLSDIVVIQLGNNDYESVDNN